MPELATIADQPSEAANRKAATIGPSVDHVTDAVAGDEFVRAGMGMVREAPSASVPGMIATAPPKGSEEAVTPGGRHAGMAALPANPTGSRVPDKIDPAAPAPGAASAVAGGKAIVAARGSGSRIGDPGPGAAASSAAAQPDDGRPGRISGVVSSLATEWVDEAPAGEAPTGRVQTDSDPLSDPLRASQKKSGGLPDAGSATGPLRSDAVPAAAQARGPRGRIPALAAMPHASEVWSRPAQGGMIAAPESAPDDGGAGSANPTLAAGVTAPQHDLQAFEPPALSMDADAAAGKAPGNGISEGFVSSLGQVGDIMGERTAAGVRLASPESAAAASPGAERELAQHVARQVVTVAHGRPDGGVALTLSPEELGRVHLQFHGHDGTLTVSMAVERAETLDLMRRHIDTLLRDLRDIGYREVNIGFGQEGARQQGAPQWGFGQGAGNAGHVPEAQAGESTGEPSAQPDKTRSPRYPAAQVEDTGMDIRL